MLHMANGAHVTHVTHVAHVEHGAHGAHGPGVYPLKYFDITNCAT